MTRSSHPELLCVPRSPQRLRTRDHRVVAAIFGAASTASFTATTSGTLALIVGIGVGSLVWFTVLATAGGMAGKRLGDGALQIVDAVSGVGLVAFGSLL